MTALNNIAPYNVFDRMVDIVANTLRSIRSAVRNYQTRRELMAMNDRQLTDIGLTRGDVILMSRYVPIMVDADPLAGYDRL